MGTFGRARLAHGVAVIILLGSAGCIVPVPLPLPKSESPPAAPTAQPAASTGAVAPPPAQETHTLRSFQTVVADRYRLRPDLRFIQAVGRVQLFTSGKASESIDVRFMTDHWEIASGGTTVGTLPEFPTFADGLHLLESCAENSFKANAVTFANQTPEDALHGIDDAIHGFSPYHLCDAGVRINAAWTKYGPDARLLEAAARVYTLWSVQQLDTLEAFEDTRVRALAFIAMAKAAGGEPSPRYEALLAREIGYANHAHAVVQHLPESDLVRQLVSQQYALLGKRSKDAALDPFSRFLCLQGLSISSDTQNVIDYASNMTSTDSSLGAAVVKAALSTGAYVVVDQLSHDLPAVSVLGLGQAVQKQSVLLDSSSKSAGAIALLQKEPHDLLSVMSGYEQEADRLFTGPVFDAEAVKTFYRSCFVSGMAERGKYQLYRSVDLTAAQGLVNYFGRFRGTFAEIAEPWYAGLVGLKTGSSTPRAFVDVLKGQPRLGSDALITAFEAMEGRYPYGRVDNLYCIEFLASRLDTRPSGRLTLGEEMRVVLYDSGAFERLYASGLDELSPAKLRNAAWFAFYNGDTAKLREFAAMDHATPYIRATILEYLAKLDKTDATDLTADYARLIAEYPNDWEPYSSCYDFHFTRSRYDEARKVMRAWLARDVKTYGLDEIHAFSNVGEAYFAEGQYQAALDAVAPVETSAAFSVAGLRVRALAKLNREADAMFAAKFLLERFKSTSEALSVALRAAWTFGHDDGALQLITGNADVLGDTDYAKEIWPALFETLGDDQDRIRRFGTALVDTGIEWDGLSTLIAQLSKRDMPDISIALCQRQFQKDPSRRDLLVYAYEYFVKAGRRNDGKAWIQTNVPEANRYSIAPGLLRTKNHELLWDLYENPDAMPQGKYIWLFRAASEAYIGPENDGHRQALIDHLNAAGNDYYPELSRILAGLSTEDKAYEIATSPDQVCETGCYLGVMCAKQNRFEDAVRWFRTAVETRRTNNFEFIFAYDKLMNIAGEERSLERLRKEGTTQY